jgi:hypothetical protein
MCIAYLLHVRDESGTERTLTFPSALLRALALIAIASSPSAYRLEDVPVCPTCGDVLTDRTTRDGRPSYCDTCDTEVDDPDDDDDDRDELCGSTCGTACGDCGRCS